MSAAPKRPACGDCGEALQCRGCDDARPTAEDVFPGWQILSPFGRWETVELREQGHSLAPIRLSTKECGPNFSWEFPRWEHVDARPPTFNRGTDPEIRVISGTSRDDFRMYVIASTTTARTGSWGVPPAEAILAEAGNAGRGKGWWVVKGRRFSASAETTEGLTKAQARSAMVLIGKDFGKALKVPVRIVEG